MHNNLLFPLENLYDSSWNQKNSKKMPLNIDSFSNEECEEYDEYSYTLSNTQKEINILSLEDIANFSFNQKINKNEKNKEDQLSFLSLSNVEISNNTLEDNYIFPFIQNRYLKSIYDDDKEGTHPIKYPENNLSPKLIDNKIYFSLQESNNTTDKFLNKSEIENFINKGEELKPKSLFQIKRKGRKKIGISDKIHSNSAFDNLQTKIQVHFISFIINISNDVLISEFGKNTSYKFKDISYKVKKQVNYKVCGKYKNSTIKDMIQKEISLKYKKNNKDNTEILNEVCLKSDWLDEFFNQNYLKFFTFYYNEGRPLGKIHFKGKDIILSSKTKTFYDLIGKNKKLKMELIETVKRVYFYGYDNPFNKFLSKRNEIQLNE